MTTETFLVNRLVEGGVSHRQAVAFERFLDDERVCGVSATKLSLCIRHYGDLQRRERNDLILQLRRQIEHLNIRVQAFVDMEVPF